MASEELTSLLNKRKSLLKNIKTKITKLNNFMEQNTDQWNDVNIINLKQRGRDLEKCYEDYESLEINIDMLDELQEDKGEEFEDNYYEACAQVASILDLRSKAKHTRTLNLHDTATPASQVHLPSQAQSVTSHQTIPKLQLPALTLPKFNGNINNWVSFYEIFRSMIAEDNELSSLHKLHYLKLCLTDEPAQLISPLSTTDENFKIAMELLCKRYDNKKLIIRHHLSEITELPDLKKANSHSLRNIIDKVELNLKILQKQSIPADQWTFY